MQKRGMKELRASPSLSGLVEKWGKFAKKSFVSDINLDLITTYKMIQKKPMTNFPIKKTNANNIQLLIDPF